MTSSTFDHVAILVRNIEEAIENYRRILSVLDPQQVVDIVRDETTVQGARVKWATFVKGEGGAALQLIESDLPNDQQLLSERGECVHHIAFASSNVEESSARLRAAGIPVLYNVPPHATNRSWLKWNFVPPASAHGVLIEISQAYKVKNGEWIEP